MQLPKRRIEPQRSLPACSIHTVQALEQSNDHEIRIAHFAAENERAL